MPSSKRYDLAGSRLPAAANSRVDARLPAMQTAPPSMSASQRTRRIPEKQPADNLFPTGQSRGYMQHPAPSRVQASAAYRQPAATGRQGLPQQQVMYEELSTRTQAETKATTAMGLAIDPVIPPRGLTRGVNGGAKLRRKPTMGGESAAELASAVMEKMADPTETAAATRAFTSLTRPSAQQTSVPSGNISTQAPALPRNFSRPGALSPEQSVEVPLRVHPTDLYAMEAPVLPHTPANAPTPSPSTRYSSSPGVFSHASTPTSMSSYSPGVLPSRTQRKKTASPIETRPPIARRRHTPEEAPRGLALDGLSMVQEASGSSASASPDKLKAMAQADMSAKQGTTTVPGQNINSNLRPATSSTSNDARRSPRKLRLDTQQAPPELAHLNFDPPQSRIAQPARPTRDNTPDLMSFNGPSPVIHSNLPADFHRRRMSGDMGVQSPESAKGPSKLTKTPKSATPSPAPSALSPQPVSRSRLPRRGNTPDMSSDGEMSESSQISLSAKPGRFGFFSRKSSADPGNKPAQKPVRPHQPGPAAGTGYEGYGLPRRRRGRRFSITSNDSTVERGSSLESNGRIRPKSTRKESFTSGDESSSMDEFLSDRLNPKVIRGQLRTIAKAGNASSHNVAIDEGSNASMMSTPALSDTSTWGTDGPHDLSPQNISKAQRIASPLKRGIFGRRNDSQTSINGQPDVTQTATTRSSRQSRRLSGTLTSAGNDSAGTNDLTTTTSNVSNLQDKSNQHAAKPKKAPKKWNFFQRSVAPKTQQSAIPVQKPAPVAEVAVMIESDSRHRSIAHYAMLDESGRNEYEDLEQLMAEADGMASGYVTEDAGFNNQQKHEELLRNTRSILLPTPPSLQTQFAPARASSPTPSADLTDFDDELSVLDEPVPIAAAREMSVTHPRPQAENKAPTSAPVTAALTPSAPKTPLSQQAVHSQQSPQKTTRLAQVGRIPQVTFSNDDQPSKTLRSTTRPKPTLQSSQEKPWWRRETTEFDKLPEYRTTESEGDGPVNVAATSQPPENDPKAMSPLSIGVAQTTKDARGPPEFIRFPPREQELSPSSSSGAALPLPLPPKLLTKGLSSAVSEDETWQEFDEYIDDVISPLSQTTLGSSTLGEPFQYFGDISGLANQVSKAPLDSFATNSEEDKAAMRSSVHLARVTSQSSATAGSRPFHVRTVSTSSVERKASEALPQRPSAQRMGSMNSAVTKHISTSTKGSARSGSTRSTTGSKRSRASTASGFAGPIPGDNDSLESQANLRFAALMTSKWLSFGRVLFSPAHGEIKDGKGDRVLILDGLGKDWSYYCALTYPDATVYNLGPGPASASPDSPASNGSAWQSLPNHRHIHHPSIASPFPFPRGFFSAVVFRFPTLTSEFYLRIALAECKRVLRPGGFLELSALDMDLVNMGNRARRAVRALKTRIATADPTTNLKPASDALMMLLGKRGFENMQRCVVGVPVAGGVADGSADSSSDASGPRDSGSSARKGKKPVRRQGEEEEQQQHRLSFSAMFGSSGETNDNDEGVTKMIARVGRWWWSSCYESVALPDGEPAQQQSLWAEKGVLRECEKRGTSFKLLVCYAQKPLATMRRTASV